MFHPSLAKKANFIKTWLNSDFFFKVPDTQIFILVTLVIVFIGLLMLKLYMRRQKVKNLEDKPIFITGCDTGFGRLLVLRLLEMKMTVFAGCYKRVTEAKLQEETEDLPGKLVTIPLDVTCNSSVENAAHFVQAHLDKNGLWGLVNNAGVIGNILSDDLLQVEDYQHAIEVNTLGVIRVTQAFKNLVKKRRGRIVTVTSMYGCFALPLVNTFVVSKYGTEAYCDLIRRELIPFGVSVHIIEPGFSCTPFTKEQQVTLNINRVWRRAQLDLRKQYGSKYFKQVKKCLIYILNRCSAPPYPVVDAYVHALTAKYPKKRYWVGWDAVLVFRLLSILPTSIQDLVYVIWKGFIGIPDPHCAHT